MLLLVVCENESHQFCFLNTTVLQSNVGWCSFTSVFQLDDFCLRIAFNKRNFFVAKDFLRIQWQFQGSTRENQSRLKDGKINSPNNRSNVVKSVP